MIRLVELDREGIRWAQKTVTAQHYLRRPVDTRCSVEGYAVELYAIGVVGLLLVGRPEATRCGAWYGSVEDVAGGRCGVTRWQVLNLARVWLSPEVQAGGYYFNNGDIPVFVDRRGVWRSRLASEILRKAVRQVGCDYLMRRPPVFLDEPYQIEWLLSYCDTRLHKGTIYRAAGFELFRTNDEGIQTWRVRLPALTPEQDKAVRERSRVDRRAQGFRARRAQMELGIADCELQVRLEG